MWSGLWTWSEVFAHDTNAVSLSQPLLFITAAEQRQPHQQGVEACLEQQESLAPAMVFVVI